MYTCYLITNTINNKVYIGVTKKDINIRLKEHIKVAKSNSKKQSIHHAIIKYGVNNFTISALHHFHDKSKAFKFEKIFIEQYDSFKSGYNETIGGDCGPAKTYKHSIETVIAIIEDYCSGVKLKTLSIRYGINYYTIFDMTRLKISEYKLPNYLMDKLKLVKDNSSKKKKVTKITIMDIIENFVYHDLTMQGIADKHGLSINNVWNILHRETFSSLEIDAKMLEDLSTKLSQARYWKNNKTNSTA